MADTKEAILTAALTLFAANGYEAVSVSQIAGRLGITKGALYRHYQNKRDIFDHILSRMEDMDLQQAKKFDFPEKAPEEDSSAYARASVQRLAEFSKAQYRYWTENEFASLFRRMLTLEQFRSREMQALYQNYLVSGPVRYVEEILRCNGFSAPGERAAAFFGTMFLCFSLYDSAEDKQLVTEKTMKTLDWLAREILEKGEMNGNESHQLGVGNGA